MTDVVRRAPAKDKATPISVETAEQQHAGDWVLMKVTLKDERGDPSMGVVLASNSSRTRLSARFKRLLAAPSPEKGPFYVFHCPPHTGAGDVLETLEELLVKELKDYLASGH